MNHPKVGIILLHFGKWETTKDCLDSLTKLDHRTYTTEVFVVDNSQNQEVQNLLSKHPAVTHVLAPTKNLGFAGGNNLALCKAKEAGCNYILFLNNDTVVSPAFLVDLLKAEEKLGNTILAGPVLEHQVKGKTFYDFGGYIVWKKGQPRHENKTEYDSKLQPIKRDFVSGCCLLIPVPVLDKIGGFNESYFLYLEDVELCLRAKRMGYDCYLVPGAKICHKGSQSSTELTKILYSWRNSLKLTWEYNKGPDRFKALLFNIWFYPALYLRWQVSHLKQAIRS